MVLVENVLPGKDPEGHFLRTFFHMFSDLGFGIDFGSFLDFGINFDTFWNTIRRVFDDAFIFAVIIFVRGVSRISSIIFDAFADAIRIISNIFCSPFRASTLNIFIMIFAAVYFILGNVAVASSFFGSAKRRKQLERPWKDLWVGGCIKRTLNIY